MGGIVMKATELQIGDWILYGDKPVKVLQLSENSKYDWVNLFRSLSKYSRKMDGKMMDFGTNI